MVAFDLESPAREAARTAAGWTRATAQFVERRTGLFLVLASLVYLAGTVGAAHAKWFWHDEIFTLYLSRLSPERLWEALKAGVDLNPPLGYFVAKAANSFGELPVASRLPSILAFWGMCLCAFRFVNKRCGPVAGAVALLLPRFTGAYPYAVEQRPYALVLLCGGLALVCWQELPGRRRGLAAAGMALSLSAAVSSHYFAVLLIAVLGVAEAVRWVAQRRIDWLACLMLAIPVVPFLWFRAVLGGHHTPYWSGFWTRSPGWAVGPGETYRQMADPLVWFAVAAAGLFVLLAALRRRESATAVRKDAPSIPLPELVAAGALAAMPFAAACAANAMGVPYYHRYVIPVAAGMAILFAYTVHAASLLHRETAPAVLLMLAAWMLPWPLLRAKLMAPPAASPVHMSLIAQARDTSLPVVYHDSTAFLQTHYYAAPELASRLRYLTDPGSARKYQHYDTADRALMELRNWAPVPAEDYDRFIRPGRRFYVVWRPAGVHGWVMHRLRDEGHRVEAVANGRGEQLSLVTVK